MSSKKLNPFKDFQFDQIQRSSCKIFTAHYACRNAALNLTPVMGTTNEFIFQIINSLIESWGVCLTCLDCKRQPRWQDGQKILVGMSRLNNLIMDPPFLENTSTVLPRLNVSLSHLHLKTKKMHKHSTSLYLRTDFCNSWGGGVCPIIAQPSMDLTSHWKPRYHLISLPYLVIFEEWQCIP